MSLTRAQREQLKSIQTHGLTWPGDLISKQVTKELKSMGYVARIEGWVAITAEGEEALYQCEESDDAT